MSLSNDSQNDPLAEVLTREGQLSGDDTLRQAVLDRTLGVIRRRRRLKHCAVAATLLGCYLAGMATVVLWRPATADLLTPSTTQSAAVQKKSSDPRAQLIADLGGPPDQKSTSTPLSQFEVLRRAGDRYLTDPEKLPLAVRTYTRALKYASADERAISPEHDTWLLMALKDAQSNEEIKHENSQL
jgi:hypothetical protein